LGTSSEMVILLKGFVFGIALTLGITEIYCRIRIKSFLDRYKKLEGRLLPEPTKETILEDEAQHFFDEANDLIVQDEKSKLKLNRKSLGHTFFVKHKEREKELINN